MIYFYVAMLTIIFLLNFVLAVIGLGLTLKAARALMIIQGELGITPENTISRFHDFYRRVAK